MKHGYTLLFLILMLSSSILAQTGTIQGRVYDTKNNQSVPFASVLIQGTDIGTVTDNLGNYSFTSVDPGFRRLVVSLIGYHPTVSSEFQVQGNQTTFVDVALQESSVQLDEVTVRQNFNVKKIESPLSALSIGVQDIEKAAGANRDVSKVIQTLPGVGATDPNRNDLIVRGGGPSENVFYLDDIEIPLINHFATQGASGGVVGIINPDFVRELNFYTGAFPANKANALSSVMDIRQKDGSKDRIHSKLSVGASDAALTLDGPIGKNSTFIVSARQSYLQLLFTALGLPFLPTYNDFQFKLKTRINSRNEVSFIGIGAIDNSKLNTGIKNPTENQAYILSYLPSYKQWDYALGIVYKHFTDNHYDTWVMSRNMLHNSNSKYKNNNTDSLKTSDYSSDEAENKIRFERNYPDLPVKLSFGGGMKYAQYSNSTNRQILLNDAATNLLYNTEINLFGYHAFAQASKELLDERLKLSLGVNVAGIDYNRNMTNPFNQFSPRFSVSYALSPDLDLNANVGRYAQQPAYTTLGYRDALDNLVNKTEDLRYIISNQAIAGLDYRPMWNMRLSVEAFYKAYDDYPLSVADGVSIASKGTDYGQVGDEQIVSTGKGRAYGVEILYKIMEMKRLNLTATYTYFRSEFTNAAGIYLPSSWDTRHLFNLTSSYKLPRNWNIAMRWRFVGGAPYTPIDPLSAVKSVWDINHKPVLDYTRFNSLRKPDTHQLDIRIDKEFYFKNWVLNLYTDIQNAYNFKTRGAPVYTNLDSGTVDTSGNKVYTVQTDPANTNNYLLRTIDNLSGTVLPTIGIIIKM